MLSFSEVVGIGIGTPPPLHPQASVGAHSLAGEGMGGLNPILSTLKSLVSSLLLFHEILLTENMGAVMLSSR